MSRIHGALITLTTAALLSACSSDPGPTPTAGRTVPVAPHDAPARDVGTPALDQWPPIPVRSDEPAGVTLRLDDGSIVLANRSARSVWLAPQQVETWFGGSPWVSSDDPKPGAVWVPPGGEFRQARPRRTDTVRVGVRLWDHASPDPAGNEEPWFVWLEVPGASP